MGKHSKEQEKNNIIIKLIAIVVIILAIIFAYCYRNKINFNIPNTKKTIKNEKTVKNKTLVLVRIH